MQLSWLRLWGWPPQDWAPPCVPHITIFFSVPLALRSQQPTRVSGEAHLHVFYELGCLSSQNMHWECMLHGNTEIFCVLTESLAQKHKPASPLALALNFRENQRRAVQIWGSSRRWVPPSPNHLEVVSCSVCPRCSFCGCGPSTKGSCFCVSAEIRAEPTGPVWAMVAFGTGAVQSGGRHWELPHVVSTLWKSQFGSWAAITSERRTVSGCHSVFTS